MTRCPFCQSRPALVLVPVKRLHAPVTPACGMCRRMSLSWLRAQLVMYGGYRVVNGVLVSVDTEKRGA